MVLVVDRPVVVHPYLDLGLEIDANGEGRGIVDHKLLGEQLIRVESINENENPLIQRKGMVILD